MHLVALFVFCVGFLAIGQDSLILHYHIRSTYAYPEGKTVRGIEVDIMNEYMLWLATKKKIKVGFRYVQHTSHESVVESIQSGQPNFFGLVSVTPSAELNKKVDFSVPYLKQMALCITNANSLEIGAKSKDEIIKVLGSMSALTVANTILNTYVTELKKQYLPDLKISTVADDYKIMSDVTKNVLKFGFVDAVHFQNYLKMNPGKVLKIQKPLNTVKDQFVFILPKQSAHRLLFNEFFTAFKGTPAYKAILERHLGAYMAGNVSL